MGTKDATITVQRECWLQTPSTIELEYWVIQGFDNELLLRSDVLDELPQMRWLLTMSRYISWVLLLTELVAVGE